ncbi:MAG: protein phosphatase 2C domain-containing protein [Bacteroides sp.]|nr:protein phosphatase 2C domain-containing protein [Bacteroides sp.]
MELNVEIFGLSDTGKVRTNNEDSFICQPVWDDKHFLLAAIDGIGGYEGGEVAAEIARMTIVDYVEGGSPDSRLIDLIKQALVEANNAIVRAKENNPNLAQMGCVATAAIVDIENRRLFMAHCGDSRLYSYADEKLLKLSHDHSLVGYREEIGDLTEEEAMRHPQRNLIERSLGYEVHMFEDPNFIDGAIFPLGAGRTEFLFCSDGLSDMLRSSEIAEVLALDVSVAEQAGQLIQLALDAGGKDNVTVVVGRFDMPECEADTIVATDESAVADVAQTEPERPKQRKKSKTKKGKDNGKLQLFMKLLPWVIIIILLGVIAALVIRNYIASKSTDDQKPNLEAPTVIVEPIVNECDSLMIYRSELDSLVELRTKTIEGSYKNADSVAKAVEKYDKRIEKLRAILDSVTPQNAR